MERITFITEYFEEIEIEKEYDGYYYKISDVITIVILVSICGLKNLHQIHQWAIKDRTRACGQQHGCQKDALGARYCARTTTRCRGCKESGTPPQK